MEQYNSESEKREQLELEQFGLEHLELDQLKELLRELVQKLEQIDQERKKNLNNLNSGISDDHPAVYREIYLREKQFNYTVEKNVLCNRIAKLKSIEQIRMLKEEQQRAVLLKIAQLLNRPMKNQNLTDVNLVQLKSELNDCYQKGQIDLETLEQIEEELDVAYGNAESSNSLLRKLIHSSRLREETEETEDLQDQQEELENVEKIGQRGKL